MWTKKRLDMWNKPNSLCALSLSAVLSRQKAENASVDRRDFKREGKRSVLALLELEEERGKKENLADTLFVSGGKRRGRKSLTRGTEKGKRKKATRSRE